MCIDYGYKYYVPPSITLYQALADGSNCTSNFSSLKDIKRPTENTTALPRKDWINITHDFLRYVEVQWIFPNLYFSCDGNISRFSVRAEVTSYTMNSPPYLSIWRRNHEMSIGDGYYRIHHLSGYSNFESNDDYLDIFYYILDRPFSVEAGDTVGLELMHGGRESHRIVFVDRGEGNSPISYHKAFSNDFFPVPPSPLLGSNTSAYIPLVGVQFGEQ